MTTARIFASFLEAVTSGDTKARVSASFLEAIGQGYAKARVSASFLEVILNPPDVLDPEVPSPEVLAMDCTIQGIINQAMEDSAIDVKAVSTRGTVGHHIVQHRAALLSRLAAGWEGVEIGDIEAPLSSPLSLVDIGEIVMVEVRRANDLRWFRVPVRPMNDIGDLQ